MRIKHIIIAFVIVIGIMVTVSLCDAMEKHVAYAVRVGNVAQYDLGYVNFTCPDNLKGVKHIDGGLCQKGFQPSNAPELASIKAGEEIEMLVHGDHFIKIQKKGE
jgi:hypothetical protein